MIKKITLCICLLSIVACQVDAEGDVSNRNKEKLKILFFDAPLFKQKELKYSPSMRKNYDLFFSYEDWYTLFNKKTMYTIPNIEIKEANQELSFLKKIPANIRKEDTAFVLGKVRLDEDIYGVLVLEPGYYSITRIFIYPIDKEGKIWRGLELADWFADDNDEIIITSRMQMNKRLNIITKIISKKYEDTGNMSAANVVESVKEKEVLWVFDRVHGFVESK